MTTSTRGVTPTGARLFATAIGTCGVGWRDQAVTAVQLPERNDDVTLGRLTAGRRLDDTPPESVVAAIEAMTALLEGEPVDLFFVDIDLGDPPELEAAVWEVTRTIPPGCHLTYGDVADRIGRPGAAQAVGRALGANPCPIIVPCHRVLGAGGHLTGFSAPGGVETKRRMLLIEGCPAVAPSLFDQA